MYSWVLRLHTHGKPGTTKGVKFAARVFLPLYLFRGESSCGWHAEFSFFELTGSSFGAAFRRGSCRKVWDKYPCTCLLLLFLTLAIIFTTLLPAPSTHSVDSQQQSLRALPLEGAKGGKHVACVGTIQHVCRLHTVQHQHFRTTIRTLPSTAHLHLLPRSDPRAPSRCGGGLIDVWYIDTIKRKTPRKESPPLQSELRFSCIKSKGFPGRPLTTNFCLPFLPAGSNPSVPLWEVVDTCSKV